MTRLLMEPVRLAEALLFASAKPLTEDALAERLPRGADVKAVLRELAERYEGHGIELKAVAGGWAFRTAPDLAARLRAEVSEPRRLSRAALETLALVAYHQPVTSGGRHQQGHARPVAGDRMGAAGAAPADARPPADMDHDAGVSGPFRPGVDRRSSRIG